MPDDNTFLGAMVIREDGSYTFESVPGLDVAETLTLRFAYTVKDADDTEASSTLTVRIKDSSEVIAVSDTVTVISGLERIQAYNNVGQSGQDYTDKALVVAVTCSTTTAWGRKGPSCSQSVMTG